jgi:hypothetical protein
MRYALHLKKHIHKLLKNEETFDDVEDFEKSDTDLDKKRLDFITLLAVCNAY